MTISEAATDSVEALRGRPATTTHHALERLRRAIVSRELKPGDRIRQEDYAESLGVSVGPVREALVTLEQEGQVTYQPQRGYFVAELQFADLEEIYGLRRILEERAARKALPTLDGDAIQRIRLAAAECESAAGAGAIALELAANRRFHFEILTSPGQAHTLKLIRLLWDSTDAYRAIFYNSRKARESSLAAHARIVDAVEARDPDRLVHELNCHREQALRTLSTVLNT